MSSLIFLSFSLNAGKWMLRSHSLPLIIADERLFYISAVLI